MQATDKYRTVLVIVAGLLLFYLWRGGNWFLYSALVISLTSFLFPIVAEWVNRAWFGMAKILGWINARILLSIVFFLVLFPVATLRKLLTARKKEGKNDSYYVERNHVYEKKDLENTW